MGNPPEWKTLQSTLHLFFVNSRVFLTCIVPGFYDHKAATTKCFSFLLLQDPGAAFARAS